MSARYNTKVVNFLSPIHKILPKDVRSMLSTSRSRVRSLDGEEIVRAYVVMNTVDAVPGRKCVDGRYSHSQSCGMIARPGGDFGYVMALMRVNREQGLGLTPQECCNAVSRVVSREIAFCMHTDTHADSSGKKTSLGCGHVAKAMLPENEVLYGVDSEALSTLVSTVKQVRKKKIQNVCLEGDHIEEGVLIVNSKKKTVIPHNNGHMYFVYDKMRDEAFMRQLVQKMGIDGLLYADLLKSSNEQLQATLSLLAKGLPMYSVEIASDSISVSSVGVVGE